MFPFVFGLILIVFLVLAFILLDCNPVLIIYDLCDKVFKAKNALKNKTVWIVGASSGIGEGLAYELARLNCRLILTATNESKLQDVKKRCLTESKDLRPTDVLLLPYDISEFEQTEAAFRRIIDEFGQLDVLVCNAARFYMGAVADDDFNEIKRMFDISYFAHVNTIKTVIRYWLEHKLGGQILSTSSVASITESPLSSSYVGCKKALNCFLRDVSIQVQWKGIYITNCLVGPTDTNFTDKSLSKKTFSMEMLKTKMPIDRCAHLMLLSLSWKLNESWISVQPMLSMTYFYELFSFYICFLARQFNTVGLLEKWLYIRDRDDL